jgi:putative tricarboxylic transport membrane protein
MSEPQAAPPSHQTLVGIGVIVIGALLAWGALSIPSTAGYAGVGPNFLPWVVSVALVICGAFLVWEAHSGGFRELEPPSGSVRGDWVALAWVSAGVLGNAALITTIGFVFACALCFVFAVRGLRGAEGKPAGGLRQTAVDVATGLVLAAPVYWLFTKLLSINLPGITGTGWL